MLRFRGVPAAIGLLLAACGPSPAVPLQTPTLVSTPPPAPTRVPATPTAAAVVPSVPTVVPTPRARPPLQQALEAVVAQHPGSIGVVVKDLGPSGQTASLNAERRFRSASLYKLFVMQTAVARIDADELSSDEILTLTPALVADDPYTDLPVGTQTSVDCALQTMLEMSGNSAADLLVDRLGMRAINDHMTRLGLTQSVITDDTAFTSPADVARLLEGLAASPSPSSARMLEMLAAQQHADRLPAPLPLGVRVAHKTGELPNLRNDAGIVYTPSSAYLFVAMVQDAPTEAAARAAIVDLSRAAYDALDPTGITLFRGLPPRLARDVFAVPDAHGRLELLGDARTETVPLGSAGVHVAASTGEIRLRPEMLPDLLALQAEALEARLDFSVADGLRAPSDAQAHQAQPVAWVAPCAMQLPGPGDGPRYGQPATLDAPTGLTQQWLGTVAVLEQPSHDWLLAHAWQHGFVFAPPETEAGQVLGHEPQALRWVGREMAADLHARGASGPAVLIELARARAELDAQAAPADERQVLRRGPDSFGTPCWAARDTTTQGCPSRWYFSPSVF